MEQHGNEEISSITVCREPIMKGVEKFMHVVSVGGINRAKQDLQYDDLFHLCMFIKTKNRTSIRNEKNEVINIEVKQMDSNPKRETREITVNKPLTLNELLKIQVSIWAINSCPTQPVAITARIILMHV